jgi:hypothetical protein
VAEGPARPGRNGGDFHRHRFDKCQRYRFLVAVEPVEGCALHGRGPGVCATGRLQPACQFPRGCRLQGCGSPDDPQLPVQVCDFGLSSQTRTAGAGKECIRMLSTCPPHVTGAALAVSSCPTTRYCWCCSVRLLLLDGPVLLVLRWPSQAVRRPGVTDVALAVSSCPTTRYCWYCCVRLLLLDGPVLLVLLCPSPTA